MRRLLVAGNWKMHGSRDMTADLIAGIAQKTLDAAGQGEQNKLGYDIVVCPPALYLSQAVMNSESQPVAIGAQNCSNFESGAYTGELALPMLTEVGCEYVLLGHSERRQLFAETDQTVAQKFAACLNYSTEITPVLCIGETLSDRQANNTELVVSNQLNAVLDMVGIAGFEKAVIAYEPVWAIGTGETASPEQAQEVHAFIRGMLEVLDADIAQSVRIVYGGSVKPDNAFELFTQVDIDGGLIGGASLEVNSFSGICEAAQKIIEKT
jgi:triosephosphate isomerase